MLKTQLKSASMIVGVLSAMLLAGCKDDSLDLGNIDTTMKLEVKDLVLPLNLAPIEFGDMIDLSETEGIEVINDEYVLLKRGAFDSEEINIRDIKSDATLEFNQPSPITVPMIAGHTQALPSMEFPFNYSYNNVDKYIKRIDSGEVDLTLTFTITAKEGNSPMDCVFKNMVFELPKGFYGEVNGNIIIDENTSNQVPVPDAGPNANGDYDFTFHVTRFNFAATGATLKDSEFYLGTNFGLKGGDIEMLGGNGNTGTMQMHFSISKMEMKTFSGRVYYRIDDLDPEDITLDDLPDVLTDKQTHLGLKNPQLYVNLTNPLGHDGITASTGLRIKQIRPQGEDVVESYLMNDLVIAATDAPQNFCLSPIDPQGNAYDKFPGAKWQEMVNLGNIVNGNGLPSGMSIKFENPEMNECDVVNFSLGQDLGSIHGEYTFFAPLELSTGSYIYYQEESTGWDLGSEDNELDISLISLTADCVSNLPVNVTITARPLNSKGELISDLNIEPVKVAAFGKEPVEIKVSGNIKDLDGMKYTISVDAGQDTGVLKPDMTLKLENLKIKVSGSYVIDADDED